MHRPLASLCPCLVCRPSRASCERVFYSCLPSAAGSAALISCLCLLAFFCVAGFFCVSQHFFSAPTLLNCEPSAPHGVSFYSRRLATYPCSFLSAAADLPPVCAYYLRACAHLFRLPSAHLTFAHCGCLLVSKPFAPFIWPRESAQSAVSVSCETTRTLPLALSASATSTVLA